MQQAQDLQQAVQGFVTFTAILPMIAIGISVLGVVIISAFVLKVAKATPRR